MIMFECTLLWDLLLLMFLLLLLFRLRVANVADYS